MSYMYIPRIYKPREKKKKRLGYIDVHIHYSKTIGSVVGSKTDKGNIIIWDKTATIDFKEMLLASRRGSSHLYT